MNFFSLRTNDQDSIGKILNGTNIIVFDRLAWHKDEISIGDIIFIVISGDNSKKIYKYENGLRAIGKVLKLPVEEAEKKYFELEIEIFELISKTITKEDFYIFPSLKDAPNIGPETKQAPNQAFRKINENVGKSIIRALFDILPNDFNQDLYNSIVDYDFKIEKLNVNSENVKDIKNRFFNFLKSKGRIETTAKQYISKLNEFGNWLVENNVTKIDYNIWLDINQIDFIDYKLNNEINQLWLSTNKTIKNWYSSPWNAWKAFNSNQEIIIEESLHGNVVEFNINSFNESIFDSGLIFSEKLISRFVASLLTKPFVICSGLSGSGKTKLAQSFAEWICETEMQYKIIPVGADWTNREPLLGYPNGLEDKKYVLPDNGALELMINATKNPNLPFFMILDEMNLSHVERYFSDFLSVMESDENILLYSGDKRGEIPQEIEWPQNLFIIGTVNIDESTYMFSPKVLDRANVIEFRLNHADLKNYFNDLSGQSNQSLATEGKDMAADFLKLSIDKSFKPNTEIQKTLLDFFDQLAKVGAEFGYRTAKEIQILTENLKRMDSSLSQDEIIDIAIMQKLLPKLHGSRSKLIKVLDELLKLCAPDLIPEKLFSEDHNPTIKYKLSFEKIKRMYKNAIDNGFASYAEA